LAAQPAALTIAVRRVLSSITNWIIGPKVQKANASPWGIGRGDDFEDELQHHKISIAGGRARHILVSRRMPRGSRIALPQPTWLASLAGRDAEGGFNEEEDSQPFLENASP
jgi:hypothetical protein